MVSIGASSMVEAGVAVGAVGVGVGTIGTISHPGISLGLGLGISRPLSVVSIGVSSVVSSVTVVEARVGVGVASIGTIGIPGVSLGLGLGLSISRPLSVVGVRVAVIASVGSVSVGVASISI